jgi:hypothetical protein
MPEDHKPEKNPFRTRAEQWSQSRPVAATVSAGYAEHPEWVEDRADRPDPGFGSPHRYVAAITERLHTNQSSHQLNEYWATLGGDRPADRLLRPTIVEYVTEHHDTLADIRRHREHPRHNDLASVTATWPGIAHAATDGRPLALLELGGGAGLGLLADRFGYRYSDRVVRRDSAVMVEYGLHSGGTVSLEPPMTVATRIGLDLDPIRCDDDEAIGWLRDCVLPDDAADLATLDAALSLVDPRDIQWRTGDYFDTLSGALADVPDEVLPVVFGANTLCCAEERHRLPHILADAGRDLVWVAHEGADNALALVSYAAEEFDAEDAADHTVLLTSVRYRAGEVDRVEILAEVDHQRRVLHWPGRRCPPRTGS